jgi:hypothetical protein
VINLTAFLTAFQIQKFDVNLLRSPHVPTFPHIGLFWLILPTPYRVLIYPSIVNLYRKRNIVLGNDSCTANSDNCQSAFHYLLVENVVIALQFQITSTKKKKKKKKQTIPSWMRLLGTYQVNNQTPPPPSSSPPLPNFPISPLFYLTTL